MTLLTEYLNRLKIPIIIIFLVLYLSCWFCTHLLRTADRYSGLLISLIRLIHLKNSKGERDCRLTMQTPPTDFIKHILAPPTLQTSTSLTPPNHIISNKTLSTLYATRYKPFSNCRQCCLHPSSMHYCAPKFISYHLLCLHHIIPPTAQTNIAQTILT